MRIFLSLLLMFLSFCKSRSHNEDAQVQDFKDGKNDSPTGFNVGFFSNEFQRCDQSLRMCLKENVVLPKTLTTDQRWVQQQQCLQNFCGLAKVTLGRSTNKICYMEAFKVHLATEVGADASWDNLCVFPQDFNRFDPYAPIREWRAKQEVLKTTFGNKKLYCRKTVFAEVDKLTKKVQPNQVVSGKPFSEILEDKNYCQVNLSEKYNIECPNSFDVLMCLTNQNGIEKRLMGSLCFEGYPGVSKCKSVQPPKPATKG